VPVFVRRTSTSLPGPIGFWPNWHNKLWLVRRYSPCAPTWEVGRIAVPSDSRKYSPSRSTLLNKYRKLFRKLFFVSRRVRSFNRPFSHKRGSLHIVNGKLLVRARVLMLDSQVQQGKQSKATEQRERRNWEGANRREQGEGAKVDCSERDSLIKCPVHCSLANVTMAVVEAWLRLSPYDTTSKNGTRLPNYTQCSAYKGHSDARDSL
jgi:hypothetical protein